MTQSARRSAVSRPKRIVVAVAAFATHAREIVQGAHEYAQAHGPIELLPFLEVNRHNTLEQLRRIVGRLGISGIIAEIMGSRFLNMARLGVPLVEVTGTWAPEEVTSVHADEAAVGKLAAEHLLAKGLKCFAFMGTPTALHSRQRQAAFLSTIQEAGYRCSIFDRAPKDFIELSPEEPQIRAWLRSLPKPVGIMLWIDPSLRDIEYACRQEGFAVPGDVVLVGVGNDELLCNLASPPLSSVDIAPRRIGYRALEVLDELIQGRRAAGGHVLVAPLGVVERASSQVSWAGNPHVAAAVRFIDSHLAQRIEVRDVLKEVSISRRSLEEHFRKLYGRSPWQQIRHLQLERAKSLLAKSNAPVEEVARSCGFAGSAAFCNTFRRVVGQSPGQYRAAQRSSAT